MNEYISKEALQEKLNRKKAGPANKRYTEGWNDAILTVKSMIHSEKAADVAPVKHGRWIWHSEERGYLCSECGSGCLLNYESDWHKSDWCPHCGAKMNGGEPDA